MSHVSESAGGVEKFLKRHHKKPKKHRSPRDEERSAVPAVPAFKPPVSKVKVYGSIGEYLQARGSR